MAQVTLREVIARTQVSLNLVIRQRPSPNLQSPARQDLFGSDRPVEEGSYAAVPCFFETPARLL